VAAQGLVVGLSLTPRGHTGGGSDWLHGPHWLSSFAFVVFYHTPYLGCHSTPGCQIGYMRGVVNLLF
jgi:hypothetical protein